MVLHQNLPLLILKKAFLEAGSAGHLNKHGLLNLPLDINLPKKGIHLIRYHLLKIILRKAAILREIFIEESQHLKAAGKPFAKILNMLILFEDCRISCPLQNISILIHKKSTGIVLIDDLIEDK